MVGDYAGAIDLWARLVDAPEGVDPALASHALFQLAPDAEEGDPMSHRDARPDICARVGARSDPVRKFN